MNFKNLNADLDGIGRLEEIATKEFLAGMPKAELHMHIDGALSPAMMFALGERNQVKLPYKSTASASAAGAGNDQAKSRGRTARYR